MKKEELGSRVVFQDTKSSLHSSGSGLPLMRAVQHDAVVFASCGEGLSSDILEKDDDMPNVEQESIQEVWEGGLDEEIGEWGDLEDDDGPENRSSVGTEDEFNVDEDLTDD